MSALSNDTTLWQAKLHARLHDPAEKALVLFRDPAGHAGGTSRTLHRVLFPNGIPDAMQRHVQRADWWASAADRPQLPRNAPRAQLRWTNRPVLIHPLTGKEFDLRSLADTDIADVKERSLAHFEQLIVRHGDAKHDAAAVDWRRTLLAYWRFGPELGVTDTADSGKLGALWQNLPADTRIPDHSIWDHLDLTSAFAGAFAADANHDAALLALSIGPVQSFVAAARSTSDLWAGSHLLARLSWEAMRMVCERIGPDAVLLPRLRGIPQVDLWLRDTCKLPDGWFDDCEWTRRATDANPLFTAALPNRFVAVVPADAAAETAEAITEGVREWLDELGGDVVDRLLEAGGFRETGQPHDTAVHAYRQMCEQLAGFPEVHWAAVPFSLIRARNAKRQTDLDTIRLSEAMAPFFGAAPGKPCGFLASPAWRVLQKELRGSDTEIFYSPNPGVLYPAVYDLAERVLAAAKAVRPFGQTEQRGWRCSLTGETEWLTTDTTHLDHSYRGRDDTLWAKVRQRRPAWAKKGEHLGALSAIKRVWPTLFAEEVGDAIQQSSAGETDAAHEDAAGAAQRFVVSTHTMALAPQIDHWLAAGGRVSDDLERVIATQKPASVALPRRVTMRHRDNPALNVARRLPDLLGAARDGDDESECRRIERIIGDLLGNRIETYYGLLLMDGDHMGRIVAGADENFAITYAKSFHPDVRVHFEDYARNDSGLSDYLHAKRAMSPNRHMAISAALNEFALHVVPEVIEVEHLGRVLYAGGDDVLAMLPAADLLPAMRRLRYAYSGADPEDASGRWRDAKQSNRLFCKDGFTSLGGRLMRMMGDKATASCGAVVAHHQAPLSAVLRELRAAERRAKDAGRNRFNVTIIKRSGGSLALTTVWTDLPLLLEVRDFLGEPGVSRRAVYNTLTWLRDLPRDAGPDMLEAMIAHQLDRQADTEAKRHRDLPGIARRLSDFAKRAGGSGVSNSDPPQSGIGPMPAAGVWQRRLENFLSLAEFLARETRLPDGRREDTDARLPATARESR